MDNHTPGPWKDDEFADVVYINPKGDNLKYIAECKNPILDQEATQYSGDEWRANARLIASAPDLLEALESLEYCLAGGIVHGDRATSHAADVALCREDARAALAKAKGE
jgi:hypothetical protein